LFDRPQKGERAVLVHLDIYADLNREDLREFKELVISAGAEPVATITGSRSAPTPRYFVGTGKAEEIRECVTQQKADVVLFNHVLTPVQERNLEKLFQCRVLDRTGLILDIFAQRARTHEGKLQVELAQLQHLATRLVRGWTHLERQKGGIGLRGPGETQLETDRRLLNDRIRTLNKRLAKVRKQRDQGRRARKRAEMATVSLVGYTNTGKSTLFNTLTDAHVFAANQLFATLDPTLRRLDLPSGLSVVLADTVGFIRHLPHDLVAAFRSTLQETQDADLLLHVIDSSTEERDSQKQQVNLVLKEIEADDRPQLEVYNKIDLLPKQEARIDRNEEGRPVRVWISALNGEGLTLLREAIEECLGHSQVILQFCLPPKEGRLRALLFKTGQILEENVDEQGNWLLQVEIPLNDWAVLNKNENLSEYIINKESSSRLAVADEAP